MSSQQYDILTERQWEVAYLVAQGRTDREIAEVLCVAPGTASVHVHEILARLGAHRRTEIAAWYASLPEVQDSGNRKNISSSRPPASPAGRSRAAARKRA